MPTTLVALPCLLSIVFSAAAQEPQPKLLPPSELFRSETIDHRASQSPVKDQGLRGTCAAFAICGALETFPAVPTDLCEQLLYATVKLHEQDVDAWIVQLSGPLAALTLDEGNTFRDYYPLFGLVGTCHERVWPYDPRAALAGPDVPAEIRRFLELARIGPEELRGMRDAAGKWGFRPEDAEVLDQAAVRDIARLKEALRGGLLAIPVGYTVHGENWSNLKTEGLVAPADSTVGAGARVIVHPGMLEHFAVRPTEGEPRWLPYGAARDLLGADNKDLVREVQEGRWLSGARSPAEAYGGHAVLVVGFDDRGFLVKNSWGAAWGDGGYCVVSYDYHRLYATTGLVLRAAQVRNPALSPFETTRRIQEGRFRLKLQPRAAPDGGRALCLSTWMEDARDANVEVVEYALDARIDGEWQQKFKRVVLTGPTDARTGAPVYVSAGTLALLARADRVRARVRYGVDVLDAAKPGEARFVGERVFDAVPLAPTGAVDLLPKP